MFNIISENPESTVVAQYTPQPRKDSAYQSEAELEHEFIRILQSQSYEYLQIKSQDDLIKNLRTQLEKLQNRITPQPCGDGSEVGLPFRFSDKEWNAFFNSKIANKNSSIEEKTKIIQEDYIQLLTRENGTVKNIYLIDKQNIHNNSLQVINQYQTETGTRPNRYDVTILINGLPLVHIELKKRGIDLTEAFRQINRYNRESFWADCGLFEFIQLFVISNGTLTKYYSNTTRNEHIKTNNDKTGTVKKTSNSFEFTSWWADAKNTPIPDIVDFTKTFFAKHSLLNLITKYCVFTSDKMLLVMRPYQIVATERIIQKINIANNYKKCGNVDSGGYIWHTTGSGKTLTSFKTAQLASKLPYIDKVLFVVDRKDLDYQTMKEYDKFQEGAANSNTSTAVLARQIADTKSKIIITTIQKLAIYLTKYKADQIHNNIIRNSHFVIIFDECHRSQFGDMNKLITKSFKKYHLFGFTGTPIFPANASIAVNPIFNTTAQIFGDLLHTYTIINAINDKNVLGFKVSYYSTFKKEENITDEQVWDIDRERVLLAPQRIQNIVSYILTNFNTKTYRGTKYYSHNVLSNVENVAEARDRLKIKEHKNKIQVSGFNSIFATPSIEAAMLYYAEFKQQQQIIPEAQRLKIATIFSFAVNDELEDGLMDENPDNTNDLPTSQRDFLESAIQDYNKLFATNYDTSAEKFQNYYKDVSLRVKNKEIDLLIVVNMFLTGFDATTLNTLWVDKNLRYHGLLQAFSRTNRILNNIKCFGNIICFRKLEENVNKSLALFGDKDAAGIVLIKTFNDYYNGYCDKNGEYVQGYKPLVEKLQTDFPIEKQIIGENAQKYFISLYGAILKVKNILTAFDEFAGNEILTERDFQDYHSIYINLYSQFRAQVKGESVIVNDDIIFEMELIKQINVNIDYILELIVKYHDSNLTDKEILISIQKAVNSSIELRNKKDLIEQFVNSMTPETDIYNDWGNFVEKKKTEELNNIISELNLNKPETEQFINNAFKFGYISDMGTAITKVLPPINPFAPNSNYSAVKENVFYTLKQFFDKYYDISNSDNL